MLVLMLNGLLRGFRYLKSSGGNGNQTKKATRGKY
jgi:hypothetical protein